eukprot:921839_1
MPRDDTMLAVGRYNGSIYLLGGIDKKRQQTIYDIKTNSFVFYRSGFVPEGNKVAGEAQFWTQIESKLYILDDIIPTQNKITVFDMETNSFISEFDTMPIAMSDGMGRACITSTTTKIFINGGISNGEAAEPIKNTYVLTLNGLEWNVGAQMIAARRSHSCIIHPHNAILYSIGGANENVLIASIEKVSIENIHDNVWTYLNASLSKPVKGLRSFIAGTYVVIIGGIDGSRIMTAVIHFIDIATDLLRVPNMTLAFPTAYSAVIMVNDTIYSFGGGFGVGKWQSFKMSVVTIAPTVATTIAPEVENVTNGTNVMTTMMHMEKESGLSMGNKVGIGFAAALLICLLLVIVFFCIRDKAARKRNVRRGSDNAHSMEIDTDHLNELIDDSGEPTHR